MQIVGDKFVRARRKKEAYRGTLTDDNTGCADLDKSDAQVINEQFLIVIHICCVVVSRVAHYSSFRRLAEANYFCGKVKVIYLQFIRSQKALSDLLCIKLAPPSAY